MAEGVRSGGGAARSRKPGFGEATTGQGQPQILGPGPVPELIFFCEVLLLVVVVVVACSYYGERAFGTPFYNNRHVAPYNTDTEVWDP